LARKFDEKSATLYANAAASLKVFEKAGFPSDNAVRALLAAAE